MSIVDIHAPAGDGYGVIYADPPWSYRQQGNGAAARHYPTMTPDEIKALPVKTLAAKDCALLMWATFPNLQQALDTIRAWGFEYKTLAFCWIKKNKRSGGGFLGFRQLHPPKRGGLPPGRQGPPARSKSQRTQRYTIPDPATQPETARGAGQDRAAIWRSASPGTVRPRNRARLGRLGKRGARP